MMPPTYEDLRLVDVSRLRRTVRMGVYTGCTGGLAIGRLQTGLMIVPYEFAEDFQQFCIRNPKACPLVAASRIGSPFIPALGDLDLRTDVPRYNIYRFGELMCQRPDIADLWQNDFAAFTLGSSATFECALVERSVALRGNSNHRIGPKFLSSIQMVRVGPFGGDMVVSMRPIHLSKLNTVRAVCARFPHAHGAPIHVGSPHKIGINDIAVPDWGDPIKINDGEVPVFWGSSVTAHKAVADAMLKVSIAQTPGHMLVTDVAARKDVGAFKIY